MRLIRLPILIVLAMLSAIAPMPMAVAAPPITSNLRPFAQHVKSDLCNLLVVGDSINTQETDGRRPCGIANAWRPNSWRGWTWPTGGQINDSSGTGAPFSAGDAVGEVGPAFNEQFWNSSGGTPQCNRYDFVGGTWALSRQTATFDATGTAVGTPQFSSSPGVFPVAYREQQWTSTLPGTSAIVHKYTFRNTSLAKFWGGDPFASKTTTARLVGYKSSVGPAMQIVAFRGSGSAAVPMNFNGTAGYFMGEVVFPTTATATLQLLFYTDGTVGPAIGTPLTTVGVQIRNANTTGLMAAFWCNSGWNTSNFTDTALVTDANLRTWMSMMLGNGLGTATPAATNGPTAVRFNIGENQTAAEITELNAAYAGAPIFKANYRAVVARVLAACAALGTGPVLLFEAPYQTTKTANSFRNNINMSTAIYELSQEYGAGFIDGYQFYPPVAARTTGRVSTGVAIEERLTSDSIHPYYAGSVAFEAAVWGAFETALAENQPLRGRD